MKQDGMASRFTKLPSILKTLPIIVLMFGLQGALMSQTNNSTRVKNIVLIHGGFVDGSGWEGVYIALKKDGYTVSVIQNPTISLAGDVALVKRTIATLDGPAIL